MPPNTLDVLSATKRMASRPTPIIFCDTCSLLDIVRTPMRWRQPAKAERHVDAARRILRLIRDDKCVMFLPPPVLEEWREHEDKEKKAVDQHLRGLRRNVEVGRAVSRPLGLRTSEEPALHEDLLKTLSGIGKDLVNAGLGLTLDSESQLAATTRSMACTRPARKGNHIADCLVYEHALRLMRLLRDDSFDGKMVFLTSNTKDYCGQPSQAAASPIDTELRDVGCSFATGWAWALHELGGEG